MADLIRRRILVTLAPGRDFVSHLARVIGVSRPLLHVHLPRLEAAGLIVGTVDLSEDGEAMKYFDLAGFDLRINSSVITRAARTLNHTDPETGAKTRGQP